MKTRYVRIKGYPEDVEKAEQPISEINRNYKDPKPQFTQYTDGGLVIRPVGDVILIKKLHSTIYTLNSDMQGLYFTPHRVKTDDLLKFNDKRQTTVLNEIKSFWGLKPRFNELGFVHKRGILLFGAPGTGKSCILKLVMNSILKENDIVLLVKNPNLLVSALNSIRQVEPERRILAVLEDVDEMVRYDEQSLLGLFDGDSQQDGIVYSSTYGATWTSGQTGEWSALSVNNDGTKMLGFETGVGVNESLDYGLTWNTILSTTTLIRSMAMNKNGGDYVLFGSSNADLALSIDGGHTFNDVLNVTGFWDATAISPTGQYMMAGKSSADLYISNDYGTTFTSTGLIGRWSSCSISATSAEIQSTNFFTLSVTSSIVNN
jgi:hypothetical protein